MSKRNSLLFISLCVIGMVLTFASACKKEETVKVTKKNPLITWTNPADISVGTALSATQLNATADVDGTFLYTPSSGTVLTAGTSQILKVDFKPTDEQQYNTASKTVTINVKAIVKKTPVLTWANPADITVETALSSTQLNAKADVAGTFVYTPAIGTSLSAGTLQSLKVDFTPTDTAHYDKASKTVTINVTAIVKKNPVITWANPSDITVGTALSSTQLNAKADVAGTFVYTPAIGTSLSAGTSQSLKVDFTPTDAIHYNKVNKTVIINVIAIVKKDPVITWANPADILLSIPLSNLQLNATADVAGTFVYTPAIGTVLNAGAAQSLKVDFTPTDATHYNKVSKTVSINIIKPTGSGGTSSVIFNPAVTYGTMTDIDGNVYKTITIGTQTWMAENLRVTKYRNGEPIVNITDNATWSTTKSGAYCNYANTTDVNKIVTYGRLYNAYAAADTRNIAPQGWHVPSDAEWLVLINSQGGESIGGGKLKESGTTHWDASNTGTNSSGFSAVPTGGRNDYDGSFTNMGNSSGHWTSTASSFYGRTWHRNLYYSVDGCYRDDLNWNCGLSIRLVKD